MEHSKIVVGVLYFSVPYAARSLGMSAGQLRKIAVSEGLNFINLKENGKLWVEADNIKELHQKRTLSKIRIAANKSAAQPGSLCDKDIEIIC